MSRSSNAITPLKRALVSLELPDSYVSACHFHNLFRDARRAAKTSQIVQYLHSSQDDDARKVITAWESLENVERKAVVLDHLIAAAKVDPNKIVGLICEEMCRQNALRTQVIASFASPDIMKSRVEIAKTKDGFNDAKLILQTTGVAPVPKSNISHVNIIGSKIVQKNTTINGVPSLEDVVKTIDATARELSEGEGEGDVSS